MRPRMTVRMSVRIVRIASFPRQRDPCAVDGGGGDEHRLYRYTIDQHHKFVAECTCGWRSEGSYGTAGMPSSVFDRHVIETERGQR